MWRDRCEKASNTYILRCFSHIVIFKVFFTYIYILAYK